MVIFTKNNSKDQSEKSNMKKYYIYKNKIINTQSEVMHIMPQDTDMYCVAVKHIKRNLNMIQLMSY